MEKGSENTMSISTTRQLHSKLCIGERDVFITQHDFETAGTVVLTYLGKRRQNDFKLTIKLFQTVECRFDQLNAFLLLEELKILLSEITHPTAVEVLRVMYTTLKMQVYEDGSAVITYTA